MYISALSNDLKSQANSPRSIMLAITALVVVFFANANGALHFNPTDMCISRSCTELALTQCEFRNHHWVQIKYGKDMECFCCPDQKDARLAAASNVVGGKGLFWGNKNQICETLYVDENKCRSRHIRDCNYDMIRYHNSYIGCSLCRPRCTDSDECHELGRICAASKENQLVKSCNKIRFRLGPGVPFDDNDYKQLFNHAQAQWLAMKANETRV